jgi:hypothetical protein
MSREGSVDIAGAHQDGNNELEGSYWPSVERICKGEDQEDVEGSEEDSSPKRKLGT